MSSGPGLQYDEHDELWQQLYEGNKHLLSWEYSQTLSCMHCKCKECWKEATGTHLAGREHARRKKNREWDQQWQPPLPSVPPPGLQPPLPSAPPPHTRPHTPRLTPPPSQPSSSSSGPGPNLELVELANRVCELETTLGKCMLTVEKLEDQLKQLKKTANQRDLEEGEGNVKVENGGHLDLEPCGCHLPAVEHNDDDVSRDDKEYIHCHKL